MWNIHWLFMGRVDQDRQHGKIKDKWDRPFSLKKRLCTEWPVIHGIVSALEGRQEGWTADEEQKEETLATPTQLLLCILQNIRLNTRFLNILLPTTLHGLILIMILHKQVLICSKGQYFLNHLPPPSKEYLLIYESPIKRNHFEKSSSDVSLAMQNESPEI